MFNEFATKWKKISHQFSRVKLVCQAISVREEIKEEYGWPAGVYLARPTGRKGG